VLPYQFYVQPWSTAAIAMPAIVSFATAALGIAGLAWALIGRRRWLAPLAGAGLILASTLPLTAYFFVRDDLAGARYLYFGAFGWGLIAAALLAAALRQARAAAAATAVAAVLLAALLHVNLGPWRQAAAIVDDMERAAIRGEDPAAAAARTADRLGIRLTTRDGVPREAGGVGLFVNGYPEFLARIRARAPSTPP
jgi:signal transduction histidine kinase